MQVLDATTNPVDAHAERWAMELDAFTHSISHDLRAPLRAIEGFSKILLEDHADSMASEARHYLSLVLANAERMGNLVEGLVAFSKLGRQSVAKEHFDPTPLAQEAWDELTLMHENFAPTLVLHDLDRCDADRALLKQALSNLLSNAIKFTRKSENARIEISSSRNDMGETIYCVRDNGVGFDMRYVHKLFGLFQRLHRAEDYEGSGVGLAIVQRIIQSHGGRAWAESEINHGTAIYFTLEPDASAMAA